MILLIAKVVLTHDQFMVVADFMKLSRVMLLISLFIVFSMNRVNAVEDSSVLSQESQGNSYASNLAFICGCTASAKAIVFFYGDIPYFYREEAGTKALYKVITGSLIVIIGTGSWAVGYLLGLPLDYLTQ